MTAPAGLEGLPPLPPLTATAKLPPFLGGVPEGYGVARPYNPLAGETGRFPDFTPPQFNAPQYRAGSEQDVSALSVEDLARLQMRMAKAGLIGPKTEFRLGVADDVTVGAYQTLLGVANRYAISDTEALDMLETSPLQGPGGGEAGQARSFTSTATSTNLTDSTTARAVARQALEQALGRAPSEEEYQQFVTSLNAVETENPSTTRTTYNYDAEGNMTSQDSVTDSDKAPSPEAFADEYVRQGELGEERNTKTAAVDYYGAMLSVIGAGGSGV